MKLKTGANADEVNNPGGTSQLIRRTYSAPELTRFGKVSQLTQAASGCSMADNSSCSVGAGSDMGPQVIMN